MAWFDTLLLKSPNPRIRCKAVDNLSSSTQPSDTERIFASMRDGNPQVRCAAVRALTKKKTPDATNALVGALRDGSFQVREAAARALGQIRDPGSANALAACLRDPDAAVRIAAAGALRGIGWKPSTQEELAWFEIALGNTPAAVPTASVPASPPVGGTNQETSFYRRMAAAALKERNDPARIRSLLAALRSNDLLARVSAAHDLSPINGPDITAELLRLFRDREPEVRLAGAQAMAAREDSTAAHFLGLLQDSSFEVRVAAVQFLGKIRNQQIAQVLFPLLEDSSVAVRRATAGAIGLVAGAPAIEPLVVSLADQDEQMRQAAEQALEQIDPRWMYSEGTQNARARLETMLCERGEPDNVVIGQLLARLPAPAAKEA